MVSKETAQKRAQMRRQRADEAAVQRARRARRNTWRRRRGAPARALKRLVPHLPDRRTGRLTIRQTKAQRAAIVGGFVGSLVLIWVYAGALSTRFALTLLVLAITPVVVVMTTDRRI